MYLLSDYDQTHRTCILISGYIIALRRMMNDNKTQTLKEKINHLMQYLLSLVSKALGDIWTVWLHLIDRGDVKASP